MIYKDWTLMLRRICSSFYFTSENEIFDEAECRLVQMHSATTWFAWYKPVRNITMRVTSPKLNIANDEWHLREIELSEFESIVIVDSARTATTCHLPVAYLYHSRKDDWEVIALTHDLSKLPLKYRMKLFLKKWGLSLALFVVASVTGYIGNIINLL